MAKLFNATIQKAPDGKLQDGRGLILVKKGKTGKWVFRYSHLGKRREMGLGNWPVTTLADARKLRDQWSSVLASGKDPIDVRDAEKESQKAEAERHDPTFSELTDMVFEAKKATLRGDGTRGRWRSPIDLYMIPALGKKPGSQLTQRDLVDVLKPIWKTKQPTAVKIVNRTRIILRSAKRMGFPTDPDIVDSAKEILGVVHHEAQHMASVEWQDIPALYARLPQTVGGDCNRWIILTCVRIEAARGARVSEIDFDTATWTVPADRVKGQRGKVQPFRVPLVQPLIDMALQRKELGIDLIFPGLRGQSPISNAAVEKTLREMDAGGTPHGFRTSFRTWVQETNVCSYEVAEMVLDHKIGGIVERTYARSDLLEQRRNAMNDWAVFVTNQRENIS
jgi:integrase